MASTKVLREERANLHTKAQAIVDVAESENRDLTAEENAEFKAVHERDTVLKNRIERLEKMDGWGDDLQSPKDEFNADEFKIGGLLDDDSDDFDFKADDWETAESKMFGDGAKLMDAAMAGWASAHVHGAINNKNSRAAMAKLGVSPNAKNFVVDLLTTNQMRTYHDQLKASGMKTAVPSKGGVLVHPSFMSTLEWAMLKFGGILQVAEIIRTDGGQDIEWPTIDDTTNSGSYVGEGKAVDTDTLDDFGELIWRAYKVTSKFIKVPTEMFEDSSFEIATIVARMIGERIGRFINAEATNGAGSKIQGIIPWLKANAELYTDTAAATSVKRDDLLDLKHAVDEAYRGNASWMTSDSGVLEMKKLVDGDGRLLWHTNTKEGEPDRFDGDPIQYNRDMAFVKTAGNVNYVYGDLSYIKVRMVRNVRIKRLVERWGDEDVEGFGGFMRADSRVLDAGTHPIKGLRQKVA